MKVDLDAEIIPGRESAGIPLGSFIVDLLDDNPDYFRKDIVFDALHGSSSHRYRSSHVDVWTEGDSCVSQIMVHGCYRGQLRHLIRLGSTTEDIERLIGSCGEDNEDNLVIVGVPGFCFEIDGVMTDLLWKKRPIVDMIVFPAHLYNVERVL